MRITEQIDALSTMAVNPIQYLVVPRVIAATIMVPLLTMVFNVVGMAGAYIFVVQQPAALEIARSMGARGLEPQLIATLDRLQGPDSGQNPALGN